MKGLVAIANFGSKNAKYLERLLDEYRSMKRYEVSIAVLSNVPKELGSDVEVIVGLPAKDPWSLPFGHKTLFAKRIEEYDFFIYTEDDTLITERNIDAFIQVTRVLPDRYISGFIRYEISPEGKKFFTTFHDHFHWDPNSIVKIGEYIFAHYTNDHSACFILTRGQLRKAIESGGFLLPPRKGRYDMLVTAATDPYTQCGMKKLVCISHLNDFCLPHLPNAYIGRIGLEAKWADREIEALKVLSGTPTIRGPLFDTSTLLDDARWDKKYHEPRRDDILSLIPKGANRVLSVGCGCGSTEADLVMQGVEVIGIPLDCVIAVSAAAKGIKTVNPSFEAAREALRGMHYDCIVFQDVLQHVADPIATLRDFRPFLSENGSMIISVPNFNYPSLLRERELMRLRARGVSDGQCFNRYRLHFTTRSMLSLWLDRSGLVVTKSCSVVEPRYEVLGWVCLGLLNNWFSRNIVVRAEPLPHESGVAWKNK
ncbi:MAG: class I SAM-dependent methyltransferase [Nitrospirota bacterium]